MTRALVIDDDDIARELLVSVLKDGGYETFELPSPIGATQTIFQEQIDVVVLDVMMPALSGDKLARMLRSNPRLGSLVIVLVSSASMDDLKQLAASVKADAVVSKRDVRKSLLSAIMFARTAVSAETSRRPSPP
jgi:CheY-like chemotaxis protein